MKKLLLFLLSLALLPGAALRAQANDITGDWQGTLKAGKDLRIIVKIAKDDGKLRATMYSIDQGGQPIKATTATQDGSTVKFTIDMIGGSYEGKVSGDAKSIVGTWTQGDPLPLVLVRATPETAWEIPEPPPPPKLMPADADPSFEVATIKPNPSGAPQMQQLTMNGRDFKIVNGSLGDLITFAYEVQAKQIVGAPDWLNNDRYDIAAVPDVEGAPNPTQVRTMMRKLLADRFKLTYHREKRDMSAYVLTVGKSGQKLTPTQSNGPLPGLGIGPGKGGVTLLVRNGTMSDLTFFLQSLVLDRPVVDQTGISGKFDLSVLFTPDDSQFNGHPPKVPAAQADNPVESAPTLFEAFQQQLGLKLSPEKTAVDVIAIDHVEKPSAN
jgi:uncharacterized protein (TIGR03435 family)